MVEHAYEQYLVDECRNQIMHKRKLEADANQPLPKSQQDSETAKEERAQKIELAKNYELTRCSELEDLFPKRKRGNGYKAF